MACEHMFLKIEHQAFVDFIATIRVVWKGYESTRGHRARQYDLGLTRQLDRLSDITAISQIESREEVDWVK